MNESENAVFDNIFNESGGSNKVNENSLQSICDEQPTTEIVVVSPGGTKRVTTSYGDDFEISYEFGTAAFKPQPTGYQIKLNDILSGNVPFKENVSFMILFIYLFHEFKNSILICFNFIFCER